MSTYRHIFLFVSLLLVFPAALSAQDNSDCLACHEDKTLTKKVGGKEISVFVDQSKLALSVHAANKCIDCHVDLKDSDFPHKEHVDRATCTNCHQSENKDYAESLHGRASARDDKLAPRCQTCHGSHEIVPVKSPKSAVAPLQIPYVCGSCHHEGSPVQVQRHIPQANILENYTESIHGEALLKKGLVVAPTCISCHAAHKILPHTDPRSSIARNNIAGTCTKCHAAIETVHRKIIRGALWEKAPHVLPVCVDCHQPHKIRNVYYEQGMADKDCLRCHGNRDAKAANGRSMYVDYDELQGSMHSKVACSQCHTQVNPSFLRPCEAITSHVDCTICHAEVGDQYRTSIHGQLFAKNDPNAPMCTECHGTHNVLGHKNPKSPTFAINVPFLCGRCHHEGKKAAVRYTGTEHNIISKYTESIHGKGLMKSGMTITATCADCHTAHHELPHSDTASSVNPKNISSTCGQCHFGIEEQFNKSVHSPLVTRTDKELPTCNDCHTAHSIQRTDQDQFKLSIMNTCGRCHTEIAKTYFDTYHGKVSQLGYTKTAKCYDCHGAHDILPPSDPRSHLSYQNIVQTCKKCHSGANRQFAGYFTHATHHDPNKYPWLYWSFLGMTALLVGTFFFAGVHTLLWLPRSLQYRKELKKKLSNDV
ncbi:MAG: hypothetical protein KGJ59_05020 [Bacteroidota bacterium]|nr:hypothetical protein [Bacteroidota bacterium]